MKFKNHSLNKFQEEDTINFQVFRLNTTKPIHKPMNPEKKKSKDTNQNKVSSKNKPFKKKSQIRWYDEAKMSWPKSFMEKLMHHSCDFDEESDEDLIERQVDRGIADLVEQVTIQKMFALEDTQGF